MNAKRNSYDALTNVPAKATKLLYRAITSGLLPARQADFDSKGLGTATNHDIYATNVAGTAIVVQVREYKKAHKNWFPRIKKNYF